MRVLGVLDRSRYAVWNSTTVKTLGLIEVILAVCLMVPTFVALVLEEDPRPFVAEAIPLITAGSLQFILFRKSVDFKPTNGLMMMGLCWLELFVVGAVPYLMFGLSPLDSIFESVSGFTTTGATILPDPTVWPVSLMVWRSFTQWVGGIAVILVFMYVLPMVGIGRSLFINELAGSSSSDYTIKMEKAAISFIMVYALFTLANYVIIVILGVGMVDALCLTFATISTGGFLNNTSSMADYSFAVQLVTTVFMFLGGVNFYLHYNAIRRNQKGIYRTNSEFRFNVEWFAICIALIFAMFVLNSNIDEWSVDSILDQIWNSVFSVVSMGTSTGMSINNLSLFPAECMTILLMVGFIGASSGSTSGGIKIGRLNVIYQFMKVTVSKTLHPSAVKDVRVDGQVLSHSAVLSAFSILMLFIITLIVGSIAIMMCGYHIVDAVNIAIAMISNLGTTFLDFGTNGSFCDVNEPAKIVMMMLMWIGRLEILTAIVFISPTFWKETVRNHRRTAKWKRRGI